jgi:Domain of Unknown Function (DUF748)
VLFSDRLIKPNYSADLTELTGKLSAFSSVPPVAGAAPNMADLELRGKAEGTAALEIVGKLNPLAKPLALDIKGKVRDLDLPPLSPYSIKYAGYGIKQGKLSVDVNYVVQPDGRLTAANKIVLKQLSFGDKVEGSQASLPVKLAVALLADRNGVIDLDLPISGSLNDPQFSLGPVILKAIGNVIVKAVTAPFSLLANALGGSGSSGAVAGDAGGGDMSTIAFAAGSATLAPEARARDGYKREQLTERLLAEKRRQQAKAGVKEEIRDDEKQDEKEVAANDPALLKELYRRADMPKPRNVIGLVKGLPEAEMEQLLLADISVSEEAMRALAQQRGETVKNYLIAKRLPPDQLMLGVAKVLPLDAKWTPRAELNLAMP